MARLVEASGIELKKGGKDMLGRCPFHEDATACLVVTPAKNLCRLPPHSCSVLNSRRVKAKPCGRAARGLDPATT